MRVAVCGDEKREIVVEVFLEGLRSKYGEELYLVYRHDDKVGEIAYNWIVREHWKRRSMNIEWTEKFDWELDEPKLAFCFGDYNYEFVNSLGDIPIYHVEKL